MKILVRLSPTRAPVNNCTSICMPALYHLHNEPILMIVPMTVLNVTIPTPCLAVIMMSSVHTEDDNRR